MLIYALQRVGLSILICITSITILFSAIHVIPGDPATIMLGTRATPEMRARLNQEMGFDQPVPVQLIQFFGRVAHGDLGNDLWSQRPVGTIIMENLPYTLILIGTGLGWSALVGIPLGCYSAIRRNTFADKL